MVDFSRVFFPGFFVVLFQLGQVAETATDQLDSLHPMHMVQGEKMIENASGCQHPI